MSHSSSELSNATVVLASSSPRRRELLAQVGVSVSVAPADVDESVLPQESPTDYVHRLARDKAKKVVASHPRALVIGADTTIADGVRILGKPDNRQHAIDMLTSLSAREHLVHTGVAVAGGSKVESTVVTTRVVFRSLSANEIEQYVDSHEPFGKAGAYAIQGLGAVLIHQSSL
ncbi:MAG: nucleoside triphosphate pyrophosphatase [Pseudomonadota bacterium]